MGELMDTGRSGLTSVSALPGFEPSRGSVLIGRSVVPLRNGAKELVLCWEAKRLPARVCEGGGWYSVHPTERRWEVRTWMAHKRAPGYSWPEAANCYDTRADCSLEALISVAVADARQRYPHAHDQDTPTPENPHAQQ